MKRNVASGAIVAAAGLLSSACGAPTPTTDRTPEATIDLVALGDSTPAGYGVVQSYVELYASYVEEDLGVTVRVHQWARNGQRASELLAALKESPDLRDDIREAEVITIWTGFNDIGPAVGIDPSGGVCGPWAELDLACVSERVAGLKESIDGIMSELLDLCNARETLILFADVGNPLADQWKAEGLLDELKAPVMEEWIDHISMACAETGIRVVHTYRELNGPDGRRGAEPEIMQDDGLHLNGGGHRLLADLHRKVGYGPLSR